MLSERTDSMAEDLDVFPSESSEAEFSEAEASADATAASVHVPTPSDVLAATPSPVSVAPLSPVSVTPPSPTPTSWSMPVHAASPASDSGEMAAVSLATPAPVTVLTESVEASEPRPAEPTFQSVADQLPVSMRSIGVAAPDQPVVSDRSSSPVLPVQANHSRRRGVPEQSVSFAQLQASGVTLQWFEAIAILQELCRSIAQSGDAAGPAVLAPEDIFITRSGQAISVAQGPKDSASCIQQFGEHLRLMLLDGQFPTSLRLVISNAVAAPPLYSSLSDLSRALEYFERPNRTALIQAVYERWKALPPSLIAVPPPPQDQPELKKEEEEIEQPSTPAKHRVPKGVLVAACAVIAVSALAGVGALVFTSTSSSAAVDSETSAQANDTASSGPVAAVSALLNLILPGSAGRSTTVSDAAPPTPDSTGPPTRRSGPARPSVKTLPSRGLGSIDYRADGSTTRDPKAVPVEPDGCAEGSADCEADNPQTFDVVDSGIYGAEDSDVAPPVAIYPQFPSGPPPGVRTDTLAMIELIVDPTGNVQSVKVREAPRTISDTMLATMTLSAAKTWRFRPAMRNGRAVSYRKTVWIPAH